MSDSNPSVLNAEAENAETIPKPSDPVIEDNSSQITTTTTENNLDPEDITDQLDELIESSPKRVKMEWDLNKTIWRRTKWWIFLVKILSHNFLFTAQKYSGGVKSHNYVTYH